MTKLKSNFKLFALARLCPNVPAQFAAIPLLERDTEIDAEEINKHMTDVEKKIGEQRKVAMEELNKKPLSCAEPVGSYYAFFHVEGVESEEEEKVFTKQLLLKKHVYIVQGSGFGYTEEEGGKLVNWPDIKKNIHET